MKVQYNGNASFSNLTRNYIITSNPECSDAGIQMRNIVSTVLQPFIELFNNSICTKNLVFQASLCSRTCSTSAIHSNVD